MTAYELQPDGTLREIADPPTRADLVQVVRCRDCKHYYECEEYSPHGNYVRRCCEYFDSYSDDVGPDGFCAWGERRVETLDIFNWR